MLTRHAFSKHRASCDSLTLADFKKVQTPPTGEARVTSLQSAAVDATASPGIGSSPGCTMEEAATPLFLKSPKQATDPDVPDPAQAEDGARRSGRGTVGPPAPDGDRIFSGWPSSGDGREYLAPARGPSVLPTPGKEASS